MHFRHRLALLALWMSAIGIMPAYADRPPKPIPDEEQHVTQQLAGWLRQLADGSIFDAPLTEKARAALESGEGKQAAALMRQCHQAAPLQLLARNVKGEDRLYRYRAVCKDQPLLVELALNKAARVDVLNVQVEAIQSGHRQP